MEEKTFLQLIGTNQGILHKICRLYRDTPEDRNDLFQEMVYQLWRSIDSFRAQAKPSTFIYRIAINTAIASFRTDHKRIRIEYTDQLPDYPPNHATETENLTERTDQLFTAIKRLEQADRAIIALVLEELSYKEIAEIIGTSENNIAVKVNRIKTKIRKLLIP